MYPSLRSLPTSASRTIVGEPGYKNCTYTFSSLSRTLLLPSVYAHFPDNRLSGNSSVASNLLEFLYALSIPQSSPSHPATSLSILKKELCAVFESHIHHSPISAYSSIYYLTKVPSATQKSLNPISSSNARHLHISTRKIPFSLFSP